MTNFLTVKEAARLTGKSSSSIRRIIYPIIEADQHTDRQHLQPSVDEVVRLRSKGENFARRMELIDGLSERLREGNVLIGSLQQRLALTDGSARMKSSVVEATTTKPRAAESPAKTTPKPTSKASKSASKIEKPKIEKPKRGFFARLFR